MPTECPPPSFQAIWPSLIFTHDRKLTTHEEAYLFLRSFIYALIYLPKKKETYYKEFADPIVGGWLGKSQIRPENSDVGTKVFSIGRISSAAGKSQLFS